MSAKREKVVNIININLLAYFNVICARLFEFHGDRVSNPEVLEGTGQQRLQDIAAERRLRIAGHIIRLPQEIPAKYAMTRIPEGMRKVGE